MKRKEEKNNNKNNKRKNEKNRGYVNQTQVVHLVVERTTHITICFLIEINKIVILWFNIICVL